MSRIAAPRQLRQRRLGKLNREQIKAALNTMEMDTDDSTDKDSSYISSLEEDERREEEHWDTDSW